MEGNPDQRLLASLTEMLNEDEPNVKGVHFIYP